MREYKLSHNQDIIYALRNGDKHVFVSFYKEYYKMLFAFSSQFLTKIESEEVVQDTMLWLWENRHTLVPELSLHSLLFTIVKNKCLNKIKQHNTRNRINEKLYKSYMDKVCTQSYEDFLELQEEFHKALEQLPENQRSAFIQNHFENKSYKEIATQENISEKTVAYRISQALKKLRILLKDYLYFFL